MLLLYKSIAQASFRTDVGYEDRRCMNAGNKVNGIVNRIFTRFRHRTAPRNVNEVQAQRLSMLDRFAVIVTGAIGTMWAVIFLAVFMAGWTMWEQCVDKHPFDPYP